MSDNAPFCTMGSMMHSNNMSSADRRRKLVESNGWYTQSAHGDGGDEIHRHHNEDSLSNEMDHSHQMMSQGTIMYMDGFRSALFPSSQASSPPPCLNLFYPSWTLHTPSRFVFAMIVITLMGILVESSGVWRVKCLRRGRRCRREVRLNRVQASREDQVQEQEQHLVDMQGRQPEFRRQSQLELQRDDCDVSATSAVPSSAPAALSPPSSSHPLLCPAIIRRMWRTIAPKCVRIIFAKILCCFALRTRNDGMRAARMYEIAAASLHALRAWLGYLLMLAVMTYAVEFLVSAVVGMVLGRYWCVDLEDGIHDAVSVRRVTGGAGLGEDDEKQETERAGVGGLTKTDGTWGVGDPCCGIDDDEVDYHDNYNVIGTRLTGICEPLLLSSSESSARVTRRLVGAQQTEWVA